MVLLGEKGSTSSSSNLLESAALQEFLGLLHTQQACVYVGAGWFGPSLEYSSIVT